MLHHGLKTLVATAALTALTIGAAQAYLPEGKTFRERAGSASSLTLADVASDPSAQALKTLLSYAPEKEAFRDKRDRAAMAEFYAERDYQPIWMLDGRLTDAARKVMARIEKADEDGLDPSAYRLPEATIGATAPAGPEIIAAVEATLSRAVLAYARDAYAGRLDPQSIGKLITAKPLLPDPIEVLGSVSVATDPAAALGALNPPQEGFQRLKKALAAARAAEKRPQHKAIADGKTMKLGVADARVPALRIRLGLEAPATNPELFDEALANAVMRFQAEAGLKADGVVGATTVSVLNGAAKDPTAEIVANMERWRWLPRDLGDFHIEVNIPEYRARIVENGEVVHETRVVVGKTTNQTPIFSDEMENIVVNPYWNVPVSIATKEMLPELRNDPYYLTKRNYEVLANVGGKMRRVDPLTIDWTSVDARRLSIRQVPGDDNALGDVKFLFPNEHAVYLHDTPSKSLFQREARAFSHGCVRVQNPLEFADVILSRQGGWSSARLRKMIGGKESWITLPRHVPIHLTYFTTFVDDSGKLQTRPDVYGYNSKVEKALGL